MVVVLRTLQSEFDSPEGQSGCHTYNNLINKIN